jgi:hypothetical protein
MWPVLVCGTLIGFAGIDAAGHGDVPAWFFAMLAAIYRLRIAELMEVA